jgi:hypothetical protein
MCLTVYESLLVNTIWKRGNRALAERVDNAAHWAFPIVYFLGLGFNYFYYLGYI